MRVILQRKVKITMQEQKGIMAGAGLIQGSKKECGPENKGLRLGGSRSS